MSFNLGGLRGFGPESGSRTRCEINGCTGQMYGARLVGIYIRANKIDIQVKL